MGNFKNESRSALIKQAAYGQLINDLIYLFLLDKNLRQT